MLRINKLTYKWRRHQHIILRSRKHSNVTHSDWLWWKKKFERFQLALKFNSLTEEKQVNTLIYLMGEKADETRLTFGLSANKSTLVIDKFGNCFSPKTNVIYERACFHTRAKNPGESGNDFVTALHNLAKKCTTGSWHKSSLETGSLCVSPTRGWVR